MPREAKVPVHFGDHDLLPFVLRGQTILLRQGRVEEPPLLLGRRVPFVRRWSLHLEDSLPRFTPSSSLLAALPDQRLQRVVELDAVFGPLQLPDALLHLSQAPLPVLLVHD